MFCSKCGTSNDEAASFCASCGYALPLPGQATATPKAQADESISDEEYYKTIIGPKNQDYYLRQFSRFDDEGKAGASWHWPAFFVSFYWLLYRKMWLNALMYFIFPYLFLVLFGILGVAARRHKNVAAVALANKNARIVWALLTRGGNYDSGHGMATA